MANTNVTIRLDKNLKEQADLLFSDFGISTNAAITMFIKQAVREQKIPFEIKRVQADVNFPNQDLLSATSKKVIKDNAVAYEELAK